MNGEIAGINVPEVDFNEHEECGECEQKKVMALAEGFFAIICPPPVLLKNKLEKLK